MTHETIGVAAVTEIRLVGSLEIMATQATDIAVRHRMIGNLAELIQYRNVTAATELRSLVNQQVLMPTMNRMTRGAS
jgi:hypothetical protein